MWRLRLSVLGLAALLLLSGLRRRRTLRILLVWILLCVRGGHESEKKQYRRSYQSDWFHKRSLCREMGEPPSPST
jgi:hypothetical protein